MSLDPQTKALLDELHQPEQPPPWELPLAELRAGYNELSLALARPAPAVKKVEDRTILGPHGPVPIRIYYPHTASVEPLPVFMHFHGGGFVLLDLDSYNPICQTICEGACCIVVAVNYRKAPENKFPKAPDDCLAATQWVAGHCNELGGDINRIAVGGDSAGGCLAAVVTHDAKAAGGPAIVFQLLVYPLTDLVGNTDSYETFGTNHLVTAELLRWYTECYVNNTTEVRNPRASPLRFSDFSGLPPAFILTAGRDPLHDEGVSYVEKLTAAGVPVQHSEYDQQIHAFWSFSARIDAATQAHAEACSALRRAFDRKNSTS